MAAVQWDCGASGVIPVSMAVGSDETARKAGGSESQGSACSLRVGPWLWFLLIGYIGQQGNLSGPLDGLRQLALMDGAGACGPAGQNLASLGQKAAQLDGVLIVDLLALVHAKLTHLPALAPPGLAVIICQGLKPPLF